MSTDNFVLRTVYIDPDLDDLLMAEALRTKTSKAELFRYYLATGILAAKSEPALFNTMAPLSKCVLVLRTVYLDPALDNALRIEAFDTRTNKNDLIRLYLRLGTTF